jgi:hypothetical protein
MSLSRIKKQSIVGWSSSSSNDDDQSNDERRINRQLTITFICMHQNNNLSYYFACLEVYQELIFKLHCKKISISLLRQTKKIHKFINVGNM